MKQPILMEREGCIIFSSCIQHTAQECFRLICYLSAVSEEAQVPLHHTQLPVVVLQASGEDSRAQGSEGTDRVRSLPSVTPLKPPDRKRRPPQFVMASDTERFTGSPIAETEGKEIKMVRLHVVSYDFTTSESAENSKTTTWLYPGVTVNLVQRH